MPCNELQNELNELHSRRNQQVEFMEHVSGHAWELAKEALDRIDADIRSTEAALELCLAKEAQKQNPVPQNISGSVEKIECHKASREVGPDEPYLLIASFDMLNVVDLGIVGITLPAIEVVKIGPWTGVNSGETHETRWLSTANRPDFWDLNRQPRPIAQPQDVIFLVAFMEHDGSSPDAIRGVVRTNLLASRVTNTNRPYSAYVASMISDMTGAIESSQVLGLDPLHLNADDLIDDVKQLDLTTNDLGRLNQLEPLEKTLRFTQRKSSSKEVNDYTATFSFTVSWR